MDGIMDDLNENDTSETIVVDDMPLDDLNLDDKSYLNDTETVETSIVPHTDSFDTIVESKCPEKKMEKVIQLPLTRIKNLMKLDPDVNIASQDAAIAITKAAELFIHMLGKEAYKFTKQNKKKTIQKKDINDCIASCEALAFLEGTLKDD
ncbi:DNA polymerase epsilon subunit 4-like [Argiope bruennichi]|uniref:DNA polymerase epsilon subunit 4 like protein n=1 Tax=Argiope bruennichi TaxID=94029 RepID=A0A8T0FNN8_ARGBR|nr:DNA polymerase epsilon subunit 4-like [Argiope bruennichi]KAF8792691.1 DNA polymerase epsilon subunit 4 like protein [Argiope bruennichi]